METKNSKLLDEIIRSKSLETLKKDINHLHPAELADLLESLPKNKRLALWKVIDSGLKGETLIELHDEAKKQLIHASETSELTQTLSKLQLDELVDLEDKLPKKVMDTTLESLNEQQKRQYEEMRKYPNDSAGGLMDTDTISVRSDITLEVVLRYLRRYRKVHQTLPEHLNSISVTDKSNKYQGELDLKDIVSLPMHSIVSEVMMKSMEPIKIQTHAQEVAKIFEDQDLISAPVVNDENRLVGRITIDDIVDVIRSESEHMLLGPVGLTKKTDLFSSIITSVQNRILWLGLNLINAFLAALVISFFSTAIQKIVVLAVLMPVVASMSGVVGNQTLTLMTRGIALSQITSRNQYWLLLKEIGIGLTNGLIFGVIVGVIAYLWFTNLAISAVFAGATLLSILFTAISGTLIPIVLKKLKLDPAIAGSVMIVAVSDILGFFIFLSLATVFLL